MTLISNGMTTTARGRQAPPDRCSGEQPSQGSEELRRSAGTQAGPPSAAPLKRPNQRQISCLVGCLGSVDLFQDLDAAARAWLEQQTTMLAAEKGRVVYLPGETGEVLFRLKTGRVQIYQAHLHINFGEHGALERP